MSFWVLLHALFPGSLQKDLKQCDYAEGQGASHTSAALARAHGRACLVGVETPGCRMLLLALANASEAHIQNQCWQRGTFKSGFCNST